MRRIGDVSRARVQDAAAAMDRLAGAIVADDEPGPCVVTNGRIVSFASAPPEPEEFEVMEAVALRLQPGQAVLRIMAAAQDAGRTRQTGEHSAAYVGDRATADGGAPTFEELSSEAVSNMVMIAASIASRPTSSNHVLQQRSSPTSLQLSRSMQSAYADAAVETNALESTSRAAHLGSASVHIQVQRSY